MTAKQKSDVTQWAAAEGPSLGDYMRRQALGEDEVLGALAQELAASTEKARIVLDRTLASCDESERQRTEVESAARRRALAEFAELDPELFAQLICRKSAGDASQP